MAKSDETSTSGSTAINSKLSLDLNPPPTPEAGAVYDGAWIRAELDDGKLSVKVFGQVTYAGRTLTQSLDLQDHGLAPLKDALQQVLDAYEPTIKGVALSAGYEALRVATIRNELVAKPENKEEENA